MLCFVTHLLGQNTFATLSHMAKQTQQLVLMLVIGILIGTTAVMAWKAKTVGESEEAVNTTVSGATTSTESMMNKEMIGEAPALPQGPEIPANKRIGLSVEDQAAGTVVAVTGLDIAETHWLAIYDDEDGTPGWILGAVRIHAGDTSANIELLRPTLSGKKYYVAMLGDDGAATFSKKTDLPPLSPDKVLIASFVAK